jgi:anti-anti-sigma factor
MDAASQATKAPLVGDANMRPEENRSGFSVDERGSVICVEGVVDLANAALFCERLRPLEPTEGVLELDCGGLSFIDAAGLSVLISLDQRLRATRNATLAVRSLPTRIRRVFELAGLDALLARSEWNLEPDGLS